MCLRAVRQKCIDVSYTLINKLTEARSFCRELIHFHRNIRWIREETQGREDSIVDGAPSVWLSSVTQPGKGQEVPAYVRQSRNHQCEYMLSQITVIMWNSVWNTGARRNGEGPVQLRWSVAGLPPLKTGFETRPLQGGFMLDEVAPGQVSLQLLRFYEPPPLNDRST